MGGGALMVSIGEFPTAQSPLDACLISNESDQTAFVDLGDGIFQVPFDKTVMPGGDYLSVNGNTITVAAGTFVDLRYSLRAGATEDYVIWDFTNGVALGEWTRGGTNTGGAVFGVSRPQIESIDVGVRVRTAGTVRGTATDVGNASLLAVKLNTIQPMTP